MRDFLFTLILLGSLQGVIFASLLLKGRGTVLPNKLLAASLLLWSLPGFHLYLHFRDIYEWNGVMRVLHDIIPMVIVMPLGPLLFFYIRSLTDSGFRLRRKDAWHFLPVIIDLAPKCVAIAYYLSVWAGKPFATRAALQEWDELYNQFADLPRWLSVTIYLWLSWKYISRLPGSVPARVMNWVKALVQVMVVFQLVWLLYLVPYILPWYSAALLNTVDWFPLYIPMTVLVYWMGIRGYLENRQLSLRTKNRETAWIQEAWQQVEQAMKKDKLFLDPALNLEKLSAHVGMPARQVSELLNQYQSTNFNGFVNKYRVEEFKSRFMDPACHQFTINGLAQECGFNSPATFQRIFRQYTGMTPTAFRQNQMSQNTI